MTFIPQAICVFLVVVIQLSNAQTIPDRCRCINTSPKAYRWKTIEEFSITAPRSRCKVTEIILTLKTVNSQTGQREQRCLNPEIYQAERLQDCWNRINKDQSSATAKVSECGIDRSNKIKSESTIAEGYH